ncbi:MAG: hypothetical protein WB760_27990 [Xanthobacteraceae bacterium]
MAALMLAAALSGCASADLFDQNERWFSRSIDLTGKSGGYTFAELQESSRNRPLTANDYVDGSGACAPLPAQVAAAAAPEPSAAQGPAPIPTAPEAAPTLLGQGIALNMSECDVVYRAGAPSSTQLGKNQNGDRTLVLTYNAGPRPGIYRFDAGRLVDMDRAEVAAPPPEPKVAKKKKPTKPPQQVSAQ